MTKGLISTPILESDHDRSARPRHPGRHHRSAEVEEIIRGRALPGGTERRWPCGVALVAGELNALGDLVREVRTVQARETPEVAN